MSNTSNLSIIDSSSEIYVEYFKSVDNRQFQWQTFDCFGLASHIRSHYNASPMPNLDWMYQQYPIQSSAPDDLVLKVLQIYAVERTSGIHHLDLLCLNFRGVLCLGTAIQSQNGTQVAYFGKEKPMMADCDRVMGAIESVWVWD